MQTVDKENRALALGKLHREWDSELVAAFKTMLLWEMGVLEESLAQAVDSQDSLRLAQQYQFLRGLINRLEPRRLVNNERN